jgi:diadenosine tetraphosphate (Ap4A) HIT family hydrolase
MLSAEGVKLVFSNTSSTTDGVNIYSPYEKPADFAFEKYLNQKNEAAVFKSSAQTVSFPSNGGNMLVIPRGNYVNFYDFALNANAEEILDFWKHVDMLMDEFDAEQFDLASHAGSEAAQTVFHFHLRFEFHDKATRIRIKEKK